MGNREKRYIGTTDEPLTKEAQEKLGEKNAPGVEAVFVSPLLRCRQTAEALFPGQPMRILEELAECDFGKFENKNWQELTKDPDYQAWIDSSGTLPFPGGGGFGQISGAVLPGIRRKAWQPVFRKGRKRCICGAWRDDHEYFGAIWGSSSGFLSVACGKCRGL